MRKLFGKKRIVMAAGVLVVALGATAAFAYWTASGTGNGNATAGSDSGVSILGVGFSGTLYPDATVNVRFVVQNLSAHTPVQVDKVVADQGAYDSVAHTYAWPGGIEIAAAPNSDVTHTCDAAWFTYTAGPAIAQNIAASSSYPVHADGSGGTLKMSNETSSNQDGCKGATITLHLKTDNSAIGG